MSFAAIMLALAAISLVGLALWEHRRRLASRRILLNDCAALFDTHALRHAGDGFPRLTGRRGALNIDVRLISDTMTIRRLPQLWLQVTVLERREGVGGLAVLVRPSGYEFYSLTERFHLPVEPPSVFPRDLIVRAKDAKSAGLFAKLASAMAEILADPRVKEIAVTGDGLRIIIQASEGRRGDYLLLRQAVFDEASVAPAELESVLAGIERLRASLSPARKEAEPA
ncbi:MAG: hypothetical protein AB7S70_17365 [Hyphomicrobium sp.]|uniref:hypothetical protein n=1 Tax=Hyphomicrobium sp. TaxID=82 RepID=UPI003D0BCF63